VPYPARIKQYDISLVRSLPDEVLWLTAEIRRDDQSLASPAPLVVKATYIPR
jgi:hypothetical protein